MSIYEDLISFETAKLAKEKGFDIPCRGYNHKGQLQPSWHWSITEYPKMQYYFAPTQSLLQKWLREEHNIDIIPPMRMGKDGYICQIVRTTNMKCFSTYEEALEEGLYEALKLVK